MENTPLKVGQVAPEFELLDQNRKLVKLSDFRGKEKVVLLFYPMDFSPVCTEEHCTFSPQIGKIQKDADTVVFGVSCDHFFSHAAYHKQYNIAYDLLSDPTRKMVKSYGMWAGEEPYNCSKRGTVVIDKNGLVAHVDEVPIKQLRKIEEIASAVG